MSSSERQQLALFIKELETLFGDGKRELELELGRFAAHLSGDLEENLTPNAYRHKLARLLQRHGRLAEFRHEVVVPRMFRNEAVRQAAILRNEAPESPTTTWIKIDECPYPGIRAFSRANTDFYFGRKNEAGELQKLILDAKYRWLHVYGPSGVGKSSLVHAGLLPDLYKDPDTWVLVPMLPGSAPMDSLVEALCAATTPPMLPSELLRRLTDADDGLPGIVRDLTTRQRRLVLVIDQLEELWTVADAGKSDAFEQVLVSALRAEATRFFLLTTIRSDQIERMQRMQRGLGGVINEEWVKPYSVGPLSRADLADAIREPAKQRNVAVQPGLDGRLWDQVEHNGSLAGGLPLIAHTLRELWYECKDKYLLHYSEDSLSIKQRLAHAADLMLATFDEAERKRVRKLFLALSNPDLESPTPRAMGCPLSRKRAIEHLGGGQSGELLLARLSGQDAASEPRLALIRTSGEEDGARVDVIHEALLSHWQVFTNWLAEARSAQEDTQALTTAARHWYNLGRPADPGVRGEMLAKLLAADPSDHDDDHGAAYKNVLRVQADLHRARRRSRRLKIGAAVTGGLGLLGVIGVLTWNLFVAFGWVQRADSRATRLDRIAQDRLRVTAASHALKNNDVALALALLREVETMKPVRDVTHWSAYAQQALGAAWRERLRLQGHSDEVSAARFNDAGDRVVSVSKDGSARIWELASGESKEIREVDGPIANAKFLSDRTDLLGQEGPPLAGASVRRFGDDVLTSSDNHLTVWTSGAEVATPRYIIPYQRSASRWWWDYRTTNLVPTTTPDGLARVWDGQTGALIRELSGPATDTVSLSPDGKKAAFVQDTGDVEIWSVVSGVRLATIHHPKHRPGPYHTSRWNRSSNKLVTGWGDTAYTWNLPSERESANPTELIPQAEFIHSSAVMTAGFASRGDVVTGTSDGLVTVWNPVFKQRRELTLPGDENGVRSISFDPNGDSAVVLSKGQVARVWDLASGDVRAILGSEHNIVAAEYSSDGQSIVTAAADHTVRVWTSRERSSAEILRGDAGLFDIDFTTNDKVIAYSSSGALTWSLSSLKSARQRCVAGQTRIVTVYCKDRALAVTSAARGRARLWDLETGLELLELEDHGTRVTVTSSDGNVHKVEACNQDASQESRQTDAGSPEITHAVCSPDGTRLLLGSRVAAQLWDPSTGVFVARLADAGPGSLAAFSPDGTRVITGNSSKARVWPVAGGEPELTFELPAEPGELEPPGVLVAVAYTSAGPRAAEHTADGALRLWDLASGRSITTLDGTADSRGWRTESMHAFGAEHLAISPDGAHVMSSWPDAIVRSWETRSGKLTREWGPGFGVAYSPDGARVALVSQPGDATEPIDVTIYDRHSAELARPRLYLKERDPVLVQNAAGDRLVTRSANIVDIWNTDMGQAIPRPSFDVENMIHASIYKKDLFRGVTGSPSGLVRLLDLTTGKRIAELAQRGRLIAAVYSPAGERVAIITWDGSASVWNAIDGSAVGRLAGHEGPVTALAYNWNATQIVTVSLDQTARAWGPSGEARGVIHRDDAPLAAVHYSPKNDHIIVVSNQGKATLIDADKGVTYPLRHTSAVSSVAFSQGGWYALLGFKDGTARRWTAPSGSATVQLKGHKEAIDAVAISPDGVYMATGSRDQTVRIWDSSGTEVAVLTGHTTSPVSLAFSPDSTRLASGSRSGEVRVWSEWREEAALLRRMWRATLLCPSVEERRQQLEQSERVASADAGRCETMVRCVQAAPDDEDVFDECLAEFRAGARR